MTGDPKFLETILRRSLAQFLHIRPIERNKTYYIKRVGIAENPSPDMLEARDQSDLAASIEFLDAIIQSTLWRESSGEVNPLTHGCIGGFTIVSPERRESSTEIQKKGMLQTRRSLRTDKELMGGQEPFNFIDPYINERREDRVIYRPNPLWIRAKYEAVIGFDPDAIDFAISVVRHPNSLRFDIGLNIKPGTVNARTFERNMVAFSIEDYIEKQ